MTDEPRWMVIGQIGGRVWSAVVTYRDEHVRNHLGTSVQRARWHFMKAKEFDERFDAARTSRPLWIRLGHGAPVRNTGV